MAGPALSSESAYPRTLRLALGVTGTLVLTQVLPWPLAHPAPVFCAILLQDAAPMSFKEGFKTIGSATLSIFLGFLLALVLLPYHAITILVFLFVIFQTYVYILKSGAHILALVGALLGTLLMPVLINLHPELAAMAAGGLVLDLIVAFVVARIAFFLVPASPDVPEHHHTKVSIEEAVPIALGFAVVVGPLLAVFLMVSGTDVLVLIYAALVVTAMSQEGSAKMGLDIIKANLLYGGIGMILVYELFVMAPFLPFVIFLLLTACFIFGGRIFSGGATAVSWSSGFNGFLLLLGGALISSNVVPDVKVLDRAYQIGLASLYVVFAYAVIDLVRSLIHRPARSADTSR